MKSRNNLKYIFEIYKQSINNQKFLLIFLLSIIFSIYGILQIAFGQDYITGFLNIISGAMYIVGLLLILLINTNNVYQIFESNQFYIIRFSSKRKYLIELIKVICFSNLCTLTLNFSLVMIGLNLFNSNDIITTVKSYEVSSIIYLIYSIIKIFILTQLISLINILLLKIINNKVVVVLNIILYIFIAGMTYYPTNEISSIFQMPLFIGSYFLSYYFSYNSFIFELLCFILYVCIFLVLIAVLQKYVEKHIRNVIK